MIHTRTLLAATAIAFSAFTAQAQQLKTPAPSPTATVKQAFALGDVTVDYSRPSAKGRAIYGDLVPYGKIWRTGANAATKLTFSTDVKLEGKEVKAGTYALYTIPNKGSWEVMLYKDLTLGGNVADYKAENELLRFTVKTTALAAKVETFTINIADISSDSATLELLWENVRVPISLTADIDAKIMKSIEDALYTDSRPYFQAANYYYENGKDLDMALNWVNKAIEQNPKAFWMVMLKAKIQAKKKDVAGAKESANKVIELAKEAKNDDYVAMAQKLIAETK